MTLRIATRGSALALWQAEHVQTLIHRLSGIESALEILRTTGDRIADVPLSMIGDRGLFTKEVDDAVLDGRADVAVHSFKDIPTTLPDGLAIAAVTQREDSSDAFVSRSGGSARIDGLPQGARIGTSSLRRRALLLARRSDLVVEPMRGNLDTRLGKLDDGEWDGIIVALAGLRRLGREQMAAEMLDPAEWLPAAGQGALAILTRADDTQAIELLSGLNHEPARAATTAERAFLSVLEGGCQVPVGALATVVGPHLELRGLVASLDGDVIIRGQVGGAAMDARVVGETLAQQLIERGALDVLDRIRSQPGTTHPATAP